MMCLDCEHMTKDCLLGTKNWAKGGGTGGFTTTNGNCCLIRNSFKNNLAR